MSTSATSNIAPAGASLKQVQRQAERFGLIALSMTVVSGLGGLVSPFLDALLLGFSTAGLIALIGFRMIADACEQEAAHG